MQVVYEANDLIDAQLTRGALVDAGIPAFVLGEHLVGGLGELPAAGLLRVCVPDAAWPEARAFLALLADEAGASTAADDDADAPLGSPAHA
jgi:hypothetical protein